MKKGIIKLLNLQGILAGYYKADGLQVYNCK